MLIKDLDTSPECYLEIIGKVDVISPGHRSEIAKRLTTLGATDARFGQDAADGAGADPVAETDEFALALIHR
ncbi:hypothetical protein AB0H83_50815 [Dactylosporangium sp. NPDC050688]|uniref:hypothetical protein n=1 Tax=Dactylosporangium sp. NPDC050688 TaxID=3157217 RepID=UPI0033EBA6FC